MKKNYTEIWAVFIHVETVGGVREQNVFPLELRRVDQVVKNLFSLDQVAIFIFRISSSSCRTCLVDNTVIVNRSQGLGNLGKKEKIQIYKLTFNTTGRTGYFSIDLHFSLSKH